MNDGYVFWLVWEPGTGRTMCRHPNEIEAEREAKRLALANTGKTFYVLRAVSHYTRDDVREVVLEVAPPF